MNFEKTTIRWKLLIYFSLLFAVFTIFMVIFQNKRESHFRTALLKNSLSECIDLTDRFITSNAIRKDKFQSNLDSLKDLIPPGKVQITITDLDGKVLYDNTIADCSQLGNYRERPEIKKAMQHKSGDYIRPSTLGKGDFYYYAKTYPDYIISAGIPFDKEIRDFIRSEDFYNPFFLFLFLIFGLVLSYISGNISDKLSNLKDFLLRVKRGEYLDQKLAFSNDEIGTITRNVNDLCEDYSRNTNELLLEKEKLINHFYIQKEGVAFFTQYKREILSNFHFLSYLNKISEETILCVEDLFQIKEFRHLNDFIDRVLAETESFNCKKPPQKSFKIKVNEIAFPFCIIFFADKGFEILIKKAEPANSHVSLKSNSVLMC